LREPDKEVGPGQGHSVTGPGLRKTCNEVVDKDADDLHIKLSDATDRSKCRRMIRALDVMLRAEYE